MRKLLSLGAAAIASAAFFGAAGPAAAKDYEYCRRDVTSFMLQCGFETAGAVSGNVVWARRRLLPSLGSAANAYD